LVYVLDSKANANTCVHVRLKNLINDCEALSHHLSEFAKVDAHERHSVAATGNRLTILGELADTLAQLPELHGTQKTPLRDNPDCIT